MKKSTLFFLIIGLGLLGYIIFPLVVGVIKIFIGLCAVVFVALIGYVGYQTGKHN